ncbi:MAG TPA: DNA polymerase III subunit alpha [Candidatus Polarisedimenticolia bacterium]|nr:DNA polymerase III subunit alpha [Candidatus Polarisedimenticolia bacterium]
MTDRSFVHLHNHSQYSLLDGASRLDDLIEKAVEFGMPAMAVTDHGNLFGAVRFFDSALARGVRPILGMEAYVAPGDRRDKAAQAEGTQGAQKKPYYHQILLAANAAGYSNLVRLSSLAYTEGFYYKPRIDKALLAEHASGLIATSACLGGEVAQHLLAGNGARAERAAAEMAEIMGRDNYYLEVQDQGLDEERIVNEGLLAIARKLKLPLVATNDCHFLTREDHFAHDVLICIQTGRTVKDDSRMRYTDQHYFKSAEEMWKVFGHLPEALENTLAIAQRCHFSLDKGTYHLPQFQVPSGHDAESYFRHVVREGFGQRMELWKRMQAQGRLRAPLEAYEARLKEELDVIAAMRFPSYFLIVWDFIKHARENGIPVGPGRGSAAGSLVAYCLRITDVDPLQYGLIFERFLNPERISLPDIDIDFCMKGRPRVIDYVTGKYGRDNVAQIITFGTMAARAVIRDAGRGLDIPFAEVDRIAKLVPAELDATVDKALASVPQLKEAHEKDESIRTLIDVARRLEGLTRHASTHAAGVVISPRPIVEFAPLYQANPGERTTQYAMGDIERIGLLKMDFLGLRTLTLIKDVQDHLAQERGIELDVTAAPLDDPETFRLFCEARTSGVFQFESSGMQDILRKLRPERFEDLIALNALYRPGPIKGGLIDDFIKRRHGKVKVSYLHPILEETLRETYGVIVYQEQVMQIASRVAGYSLGEADNLRRAMGKKKKEVMAAEREKFLQGARERRIPEKTANEIFDLMEHFAGYGFNKSHSCAYALVAYHTAYLKAHHPEHFMAALLTTEMENSDNIVKYIGECREMGIEVLPPDANTSRLDFSVEGAGRIRFGLLAVKNVGESAIRSVLEARARLGRFRGLGEFCENTDGRLVNKRVVESLVKAGAFDFLRAPRARLAAAADAALERAARRAREKESGQASLFGGAAGPAEEPEAAADILPDVPPWSDRETLAYEKETLGFYVTGHPLAPHAEELAELCSHTTAGVGPAAAGSEVTVGGIVTALKKKKTRKGDWMATFNLEDLEGSLEVIVFPDLYGKSVSRLVEDATVLVTGKAEVEDRARLLATTISSLQQAREGRTLGVAIQMVTTGLSDETLAQLKAALEENKGSVPLYLELSRPGGFVITLKADPSRFGASPGKDLRASVESILGKGAVKYRSRSVRAGS